MEQTHNRPLLCASLGTRPFAKRGRVRVRTYIRVVPRTECSPDKSESLIANDFVEMIFSRLSVSPVTTE